MNWTKRSMKDSKILDKNRIKIELKNFWLRFLRRSLKKLKLKSLNSKA